MSDEVCVVYLRFDLAIRMLVSWMQKLVLPSRCFHPGHACYLRVNHESQNVGDVVEGKNAIFASRPEPFVVRIALLHHCSYAIDHLRVVDRDFEIWTLLIALEAKYIFPHAHLHGCDDGRVLIELFLTFALKEGLVWSAVFFVEVDRRGDVEVMQETGDVQEDRVAILGIRCQYHGFANVRHNSPL